MLCCESLFHNLLLNLTYLFLIVAMRQQTLHRSNQHRADSSCSHLRLQVLPSTSTSRQSFFCTSYTMRLPRKHEDNKEILSIPEDIGEEAVLEKLGYQQGKSAFAKPQINISVGTYLRCLELKRTFSLLGMIGFSFSIVTRCVLLES